MWNQLQIKATATTAEVISDLLLSLGAVAVTLLDAKDQPLLEPGPGETPLWNDVWVSGLFTTDIDINEILIQFKTIYADPNLDYRMNTLADEDWTRSWLEHFHPLQFGDRLWVTPTEKVADITAKNAVIVLLDPGLAFGTGTHPTTALCLEWLDQSLPNNASIMDYGAGSGILAIAALKLGAKKAWAIDNDPQALIATHENALRNKINLPQLIIATPTDAILKDATPDIIIANILAAPLQQLAPQFAAMIKPSGKIVLSGILSEQADSVLESYSLWFEDFSVVEKEGWIRISASKKT